MKTVRAPGCALPITCSVKWMIPRPAGCFATTDTSPGPETAYAIPVSSPLSEKMHMSTVAVPLAGRVIGIGFPAKVQLLFTVEKIPSAPTFRSTDAPGASTPAVVGSTTVMSTPSASGAELVRLIAASDAFGAATTSGTLFDFDPSGFCTCTLTLPGEATSEAKTGAVHSPLLVQFVVRSAPPINNADPGPGLEAANPLPSTRSVKPFAPPAYTLAG